MASTLHSFANAAELAASLADKVSGVLSAAIAARGAASIAVSGGSTPKAFFQALSTRDIDWAKVTITLVDERFVPADNPRSNHLLVDANLLQNKAKAARFVPLYQPAASVEEAAKLATVKSAEIGIPFDVVILGMGGDGHTASFFPDAGNLDELLDPASRRIVLPVHAASGGEPRLTLSMACIVAAGFVALHIEGEDKRTAFNGAMGPGAKKPIRSVLEAAPRPVEVFWAP
jgi:6-phosphogluconolactonase